ncbi:hypothetical protein Pd630_LPD14038 (plasmid) [Rhodococcus opacus PD630]|nr:hypothetical protein Pd630_LPD14038 [Rhodococcus opacus PD630]
MHEPRTGTPTYRNCPDTITAAPTVVCREDTGHPPGIGDAPRSNAVTIEDAASSCSTSIRTRLERRPITDSVDHRPAGCSDGSPGPPTSEIHEAFVARRDTGCSDTPHRQEQQ